MNRRLPDWRTWHPLVWVLLLGLAIGLATLALSSSNRASSALEISYDGFRQHLKTGNVERVTISGEEIRGSFKQAVEVESTRGGRAFSRDFRTYFVPAGDGELFPLLEAQGVRIEIQPPRDLSWWRIALDVLPVVILLGLGFLLFKRVQNSGPDTSTMLRSGAKPYSGGKVRTTFTDVAGAQGTKTELQEIIEYLRNPARFQRLGAEIPRGVLLVGPPGTGKTLLARAVAGEADVPFFSITGSDFVEVFVGVGASRVRDLFKEAKKAAPSIIYIDELDSIGRRRGAGLGGAQDERDQTLNQLLAEMDGFERSENVIVIASTNRPDILDPALLRPGRFDRHVTVDLPTMLDRLEILKIHARNKPLADGLDLESLARGTPGFSGAQLENVLNEAALLAARKYKSMIEQEDIEEAKDKVLMGLVRENLVLTAEELKVIAYHEAGHAIVAAVLPYADRVHKVTIVPRGRAMGVTQQLPDGEKYIFPREYMWDRLAVMMGGRAAEDLVLETATTGAENDLKQATRLARKMVLDWGMGKRLGLVAPGDDNSPAFLGDEIGGWREYSEVTAREVDEEIKEILEEAYGRAMGVLQGYPSELDRLAAALLEKEIIPGEVVLHLIAEAGGSGTLGTGDDLLAANA